MVSQHKWLRFLRLPLTIHVTWDHRLPVPVPWFPSLLQKKRNGTNPTGLFGRLKKLVYVACLQPPCPTMRTVCALYIVFIYVLVGLSCYRVLFILQ